MGIQILSCRKATVSYMPFSTWDFLTSLGGLISSEKEVEICEVKSEDLQSRACVSDEYSDMICVPEGELASEGSINAALWSHSKRFCDNETCVELEATELAENITYKAVGEIKMSTEASRRFGGASEIKEVSVAANYSSPMEAQAAWCKEADQTMSYMHMFEGDFVFFPTMDECPREDLEGIAAPVKCFDGSCTDRNGKTI